MDVRCFKLVAGVALLIGGGPCGLLAPAARAGDPIEFSAPAIPLAVPHAIVEIRQPNRMFTSPNVASDVLDASDAPPPVEGFAVRVKKSKDDDLWGSNSLLDGDEHHRFGDDLFPEDSGSKKMTNSAILNMQRGWGASDAQSLLRRKDESGLAQGQDGLRFGGKLEIDKNQREGGLFGRMSSTTEEDSIWTRGSRGQAQGGMGKSYKYMPFMVESRTLTSDAPNERMNDLWQPATAPRIAAAPPGYESATPSDPRQDRRGDEQTWGGPTSPREWDSSSPRRSSSRNISNPSRPDNSHRGAPNAPVDLPMPHHPGDPF